MTAPWASYSAPTRMWVPTVRSVAVDGSSSVPSAPLPRPTLNSAVLLMVLFRSVALDMSSVPVNAPVAVVLVLRPMSMVPTFSNTSVVDVVAEPIVSEPVRVSAVL